MFRPELVQESGIKFLLLPKTMFGECLDVNIIVVSGCSSIWGLPPLKLTALLCELNSSHPWRDTGKDREAIWNELNPESFQVYKLGKTTGECGCLSCNPTGSRTEHRVNKSALRR